MECSEARRRLDASLDQALTADEQMELDDHLQQCEACWAESLELQGLLTDLQDPELLKMVLTEPSPLPADFTAQVMQRVEAEMPAGLNLVWPWLRRKWTGRQYASVAYAMGATMVLVSAGNLFFLWNQTTDRLGVWSAQAQAYVGAAQAQIAGGNAYLASLWQGLLALLHLV